MKIIPHEVLCDDRERARAAALDMIGVPIKISVERLTIGDFIISPRVGIEVKGAFKKKKVKGKILQSHDFTASMKDGRLEDQCRRLSEAFEVPVMIIEDFPVIFQTGVNPDAVAGMLSKIIIQYGISIMPSIGKAGTARLIAALARRVQKKKKDLPIKIVREKYATPEEYRPTCIQASYLKVGPEICSRLMEYYKTPEAIHDAFLYAAKNIKQKTKKDGTVVFVNDSSVVNNVWQAQVPAKTTYLNKILWGVK